MVNSYKTNLYPKGNRGMYCKDVGRQSAVRVLVLKLYHADNRGTQYNITYYKASNYDDG